MRAEHDDRVGQFAHRLGQAAGKLRARTGPRAVLGERGAHLAGGFDAAQCQAAHFIGKDRKTATLVAGPRGFDLRVEGEHIGAERNLLQFTDSAVHPLRVFIELGDRAGQFVDPLAAITGNMFGVMAQFMHRARGDRGRADTMLKIIERLAGRVKAVGDRPVRVGRHAAQFVQRLLEVLLQRPVRLTLLLLQELRADPADQRE